MKKQPQTGKTRACYYCGQDIKASIIEHVKTCRAKTSKCNFCNTIGNYESVCRKKKAVRELTSITPESQLRSEEDAEESGIYNINIFRVTHTNPHQPRHTSQRMKEDFKVQVIVNNSLATVLADTGASISVCGKKEAKRWNLLPRMVETQARIKPYNSPPIPTAGTTKCAVTFGNRLTNMAVGHGYTSSVKYSNFCVENLNVDDFRPHKMNYDIVYDGKRLKWNNNYVELRIFFENIVGVSGKWTVPSGNARRFQSNDSELIVTWYRGKQRTLLFQGIYKTDIC